jgi:hypothetical protein
MRLGVLCLGLVAAAAAHGQRNKDDDTEATARACSVSDCFLERDIRDFEVIDRTHLVIYVGQQRCAFHVELSGALCDLSFAPELYFRRSGEVPMITTGRAADPLSPGDPTTPRASRPGDFDTFAIQQRERRDLRICRNDLGIQVHGGQFTESGAAGATTDRFGNPRTDCRISNVRSITDDQLVELYVGRGVLPPLPPMGTGQIEVGEQEEQGDAEEGAATADSEGAHAEPEADARPARRRRN